MFDAYQGMSLPLRDLPEIGSYGSQIVSHASPLSFAMMFIGKKEHSAVDAIIKAGDQYNQFKMAFLKKISEIDLQIDPVRAVDRALLELNQDKDVLSPYYLSDMVAYGTDKDVRIAKIASRSCKITE
jgi:hypothetical protein